MGHTAQHSSSDTLLPGVFAELVHTLFTTANEAMFVVNDAAEFIEINAAGCQLAGYDREALLRLSRPDLLITESSLRPLPGVVSGSANTTTLRDGHGRSLLLVRPADTDRHVHDIAARKHVEDELRQKSNALENSLNGYDVVSAEGKILYANRAYLKMWGYDSLDEIFGASPVGHCADPTVPETIIRNLEEKGEHTLQFTALRKDGSTFEVLMSAQKVVDDDGIVTYVGTSIDLSDRYQAQQELLAERARLRNLLNAIPDMVWLKDPDGVYLACNPMFEQFVGVKEENILGKTDYDFFAPELAQFFRQYDKIAVQARKSSMNEEWLTFATDGRRILAETIKTPLFTDAGQLLGVLGIARDITGRVRMQEALRESEEKLRLFIEHAPASLAMFDQEMRYLAVSHRWLADYGLEDIIGRCHYEVFPEIPDRWKAFHQRGLAGEVVQADDDTFVRSDGRTQWLRWEILPWTTAEKTIGGIVIFSEDITERKQIQEALSESQSILAAAEAVAQMGSWEWDLVTQKVTWSDQMFHLFGIDPDTFDGDLNQVINARIHPDDLEAVQQSNASVLEDDAPLPLQYRIVLPDGKERVVWAEGRLVRGLDGRSTALVGYVQDITGRKQAETALRESEARYHHTLENMLEGCQIIGFDWRFLYLNESVLQHSRRSRKELLGRTFQEVYPGIAHTDLFTTLNHCMTERVALRLENEFVYDNGDTAWFDLSIQPVPEGLFILSIDITERKQAEATIAHLNRRMELILNSAGEGIYGTDVNGRITFVNPAMAHMLGWEPAELLDQHAYHAFHHTHANGEPYPAHECHIHLSTLEGQSYQADDEVYWCKDGTPLAVECISTPIREKGQVVGTVLVVKDITERKRATAEQTRLEEQLRQAQKMESIGRLAGGVAHDFNNQLTIIQIYGDLMRSKMAPDDPLLPKLEQVLQAGQHAAGLTRQLLAFSRKQLLQPAVINLNDLVSNLQNMLARLIGEDITFTTFLQAELWPVKADPGQIEQVIMNLVVNARDAMPTGGMLTIETQNLYLDEEIAGAYLDTPLGPCVMLAVTDTGHGMDTATQKQIFEPFFTTKRPGEGTGLGLATVHGIIKQSGGAIHVYSEPGRGSTFKLYLPASITGRVEESARPAINSLELGHETILLVEDEQTLSDLVRMTLEEAGYTVLAAHDGNQALVLAQEFPSRIDLLLTDVVMPQMSGREVVQRISQQRPEVKVLFMSGYMDDAVVRHGLLTAEVDFLPKPFTRHVLTAKVREVLDK